MKNDFISAQEFDSIVPVDDLCMAVGMNCTSQLKALRHYQYGQLEYTVNTARNEWRCPETQHYGIASDLAIALGISGCEDLSPAMEHVAKLYSERERLKATYQETVFSTGLSGFKASEELNSSLSLQLTRMGFSKSVVDKYTTPGMVPNLRRKQDDAVIAFRPDANQETFLAFTGNVYHRIGELGMTSYGSRAKNQICMVYENPLDFLALMEANARNGVGMLMDRRYHIILNGRHGLKEACEFLKANPDFLEVRCFMPDSDYGKTLFNKVNDSVKGTALDLSNMYGGEESLFASRCPRVPDAYKEWVEKRSRQEYRLYEESKVNVRQTEIANVGQAKEKKSAIRNPLKEQNQGGMKL